MSESRVEEIISALWAIAAVVSFGFGFNLIGWGFAIKAVLDTGCSIWMACKEVKSEK